MTGVTPDMIRQKEVTYIFRTQNTSTGSQADDSNIAYQSQPPIVSDFPGVHRNSSVIINRNILI